MYIRVSEGHRGSNKWSPRFWRPGCTWQPVSCFSQYTVNTDTAYTSSVHVSSCLFPDLIPPPPSFHLILFIPLCQHQAFPLMKCLGPYSLSSQFYPFTFFQLIFCLSLLHCLWAFISHLAAKGNKRPTYWGCTARLCHFLLSRPPFCLLFLFVVANLIREMGAR